MFPHGWRIALAWTAVLHESASCTLLEFAFEERERERGETDVHWQDEREESKVYPASRPENRKVIAGVPVDNYRFGESENATKMWVVTLSLQTSDEELEGMCGILNQTCDRIGYSNSERFLEITGTDMDVETMILQSSVTVIGIELEPDVTIPPPPIGADSHSMAPWGLQRIGADMRGAQVAHGVTIFVVDSGVRHTHQEFNGRAAGAGEVLKSTVYECNGDLECADDTGDYGHGTSCAGLAAGRTVGVAPGATIKALRVASRLGRGRPGAALRWIAESLVRPAIASVSISGRVDHPVNVHAVVDYNYAVASGVVVVVAAGNNARDACLNFPAALPTVVTVGAMTYSDERARFSNFGSCVDVWAPGAWNLKSPASSSDTAYRPFSGTSAACPSVAGVVAVIQGMNRNATPDEVREELMRYAEEGALSGLTENDTNLLVSATRLPCV